MVPVEGATPGRGGDHRLLCRRRLAAYKCPKTIRFVETMPKGPTGKLLRRRLVETYRTLPPTS